MVQLSKINMMSAERFNTDVAETDDKQLYFVKNPISSIVFETLKADQRVIENLPTPLPLDLSKVYFYAYIKYKKAVNGYDIGEIVPVDSCWMSSYKPLVVTNTRTQVSYLIFKALNCQNKTTTGEANVINDVELHVDFYAL